MFVNFANLILEAQHEGEVFFFLEKPPSNQMFSFNYCNYNEYMYICMCVLY